jgi:GT2 family glycosyltransferase
MEPPSSLTLVINTFNQPDFLLRVLNAVTRQTEPPQELILADDGSDNETRRVFDDWAGRQLFACHRTWQERAGFRRARILNLAIARATKQYLVFLDGDTVPHPRFLSDHWRVARPGIFVQGHRALIEKRAAAYFGIGQFSSDRRRALLSGQLHGLKHAYRWLWAACRERADLRGIRGCNLAVRRDDLLRVNGYNEAFIGWGREDSELAVRLMNAGVRRLDVRGWALCYHLWHPPASRENLPANDELLNRALAQRSTRCDLGVSAHL